MTDDHLSHEAWVAFRDGLSAAFDEGAETIKYGGTSITRDGDRVTFNNPLVPPLTVIYRPDVPEELAAAWRGFGYAVIAECEAGMADIAPFVRTGELN